MPNNPGKYVVLIQQYLSANWPQAYIDPGSWELIADDRSNWRRVVWEEVKRDVEKRNQQLEDRPDNAGSSHGNLILRYHIHSPTLSAEKTVMRGSDCWATPHVAPSITGLGRPRRFHYLSRQMFPYYWSTSHMSRMPMEFSYLASGFHPITIRKTETNRYSLVNVFQRFASALSFDWLSVWSVVIG